MFKCRTLDTQKIVTGKYFFIVCQKHNTHSIQPKTAQNQNIRANSVNVKIYKNTEDSLNMEATLIEAKIGVSHWKVQRRMSPGGLNQVPHPYPSVPHKTNKQIAAVICTELKYFSN